MVKRIIHLLIRDAARSLVPLSRIVIDQLLAGHEASCIAALIEPGRGLEEFLHRHLLALIRMVAHGDSITEFNTAGEDAVVLTGSNGIDRFFNRVITGAAGLGMMYGSLTLHAEPVRNLNVRGQIVGAVERGSLSVEVEIHILRTDTGIFHRFQRRITEHLAFCETICLLPINRIHERRAPDANDGNRSQVRIDLSLVHNSHNSIFLSWISASMHLRCCNKELFSFRNSTITQLHSFYQTRSDPAFLSMSLSFVIF